MRKRWITVFGSVLAVVCLFLYSPVAYAAQQFPHKSGSASGDVSAYYTIEYRGLQEFLPETEDSDAYVGFVFHVAFTLRNTSTKIQVANTTNFRLSVQGFQYMNGSTNRCDYDRMSIQNAFNCDVNDFNYNNASSNTTNEFYMNMFPTFTLVLEPENKVAFSFDIVLPILSGPAYTPPLSDAQYASILSNTSWSSSVWNFTDLPTFTGFTVEEYANQKEGFWPYLIRALQKIVNGNTSPYEDQNVQDQGQTVSDIAQENESNLGDMHQAETGFYESADDALSDVGFESFEYDASTTGGLNWFNARFTDIWNNLGSFSVVPVFSMLLSLAVMILRHEVSRNG